MDAKTTEKVSKLAKQLRDLHMAGSIEEATARAKEIIENAASGEGGSVGDLKKELGKLKQDIIKEAQEHEKDKKHFKKVKKKSDELKEDVEEWEEAVEKIEKVQEKK